MDDHQMLEGCRRGDGAWRLLVDRCGRLVHAVPVNLGLAVDDVEDVVQATFTALLQGIDSIRDTERLGAWLATVAKRQAIRIIERRERDRRGLDHLPTDAVDDDDWQRRVEEIEWVDQALANVTPRCRRLLLAMYFRSDEMSYDDLARELGTPRGSLGPTRSRCLAALEAELQRLQDARRETTR